MKMSTRILILIAVIMLAGLLSSNMILKKQYDAIDKSDVYWTYTNVLEQPYKYLNITGGNGTTIFYEPSANPSVRILQEWKKYHNGNVKAYVKNDTLFLNFDYQPANLYEKFYLENASPVRIFAPELLAVRGSNTHFEMLKCKQKAIDVAMSGKSSFEVESMYPELDSINVNLSDSSAVKFEMSPDYKKISSIDLESGGSRRINIQNTKGIEIAHQTGRQNDFDETMSIKSVSAIIRDHSILNIGHAQVQKMQLNITDSSAIVLSGNALRQMPK